MQIALPQLCIKYNLIGQHYLLENVLELFRQCGWFSIGPGLIELTVGVVREHMVEYFGGKHPTTARNKQWSPVLLEKHHVLEEAGRHVTSRLLLCQLAAADFSRWHL